MTVGKIARALLACCCAAQASNRLPQALFFEPNVGQVSGEVSFLSRGLGHTLLLTPTAAVMWASGSELKLDLLGANPGAEAVGLDPLKTRVHYLIGDKLAWRTDVPTYAGVEYRNVYQGVDVVYRGGEGRIEYDFMVHPGAEPSQIRLRSEVAEGKWRHSNPEAYQTRNSTRKTVGARLIALGPDTSGFETDAFDRGQTMVLSYSTYLGGSGQDEATSIAVDASGNTYVTGWTESRDFPEAAGTKLGSPSGLDAYVAKMSPSKQLVYITYLGGAGEDRAFGISVDSAGNAVVTGWTYSTDFPVVNPVQTRSGGGRDGFVAKLNAIGNALIFSTYVGGTGADSANAVAVDAQGNIYVAGETTSANFPVMSAYQSAIGGGDDAFVAKFSGAGTRLYSTFIGGAADDRATGIAVDASGYAYITGSTYSSNFPVIGAYQWTAGGGQDAFVAKIGPAGNSLVYGTYIGGTGAESANGIAVDSLGCAYIAGTTSSMNFPVMNPLQSSLNGSQDAFVSKLSAMGGALVYSTYLGGSSIDVATAIAIDNAGAAYVAGYTASTDFPVTNAVQTSNAGGYDAFVAVLTPAGNTLQQATYLGGTGSDSAYGVAVDASGDAYVAGQTMSLGFAQAGAIQSSPLSGASAFWAEMTVSPVGLRFVPIPPCRVADTRNAVGPLGGPSITGKTVRSFTVPESDCGVPPVAQAYSLNITAVPHGSLGYLTVWATGQPQPVVSTLNSYDGRVKASAAIVPAGTGGGVSFYVTDTADVVIDINGYFVPATVAGSLAYYPVPPCRVVDTRNSAGPLGGPSMAASQMRTFPVQSSACGIPAEAQAYALNFTAVPGGPLGFIAAWPAGGSQPAVSTLNALTGAITANAAIVPAGTNGSIDVVATDKTDLAIDINGYFAPPGTGGLSLYTLPGCRVLDTRLPSGSPPVAGTMDVNVTASSCNVSPAAQAFILNATVIPSGEFDFLTLWPQGQTRPGVSTLNALDGALTSNLAIVPNANGAVDAFLTQTAQLLLDTSGYFAQ